MLGFAEVAPANSKPAIDTDPSDRPMLVQVDPPKAPSAPMNAAAERMPAPDAKTNPISSDPLPAKNDPAKPTMRAILSFRELSALMAAAQKCGGSIVISIEPKDVSWSDLAIPLQESGNFDVVVKDSIIQISSAAHASPATSDEINRLEMRRDELLRQIKKLEVAEASAPAK